MMAPRPGRWPPRCLLLLLLLAETLEAEAASSVVAAKGSCMEYSRPKQDVKLRLLMRDWQSHQLVTNVAAILLRDVMKFDVEIVPAHSDWKTSQDYERLAKGEIDTNLEIWPGGKEEAYATYVEEGEATDVGIQQVAARTGMYVPVYAAQAKGFYSYYQLGGEEAQDKFKPASIASGEEGLCGNNTNWTCVKDYCAKHASAVIWQPDYCTGRRCDIQLLKGPIDYDVGLLEQQIRNNRLDVSVAYTNSSTQEKAVWDAYARKEQVLFYSWTPREPINGISHDQFTHVAFPPSSKGCLNKNNGKPSGGVDCDLPSISLRKVVSPKFLTVEAKDALYFVERFSLTEEDYAWLLAKRQLTIKETDPDAVAACLFVRAFEERWKPWVTYTKRIELTLDDPCFPTIWAQLVILSSILAGIVITQCRKPTSVRLTLHRAQHMAHTFDGAIPSFGSMSRRQRSHHSAATADIGRSKIISNPPQAAAPELKASNSSASESSTFWTVSRRLQRKSTMSWTLSILDKYFTSETARVKCALLNHELYFLSNQRTLDNFALQRGDPHLVEPPACPIPMRGMIGTKTDVLLYLVQSSIRDVFVTSLVLGMIGGIWGTFCHMVAENHKLNVGVDANAHDSWETFGENLQQLGKNFAFLPVLLLGFFVNRETSRWVDFVNIAYKGCGLVQDMALILAGAVHGVNDPETQQCRRESLFKAYRYLNCLHYMSFYGVDIRMGTKPSDVLWDLVYAGLLSEDEAHALRDTPGNLKHVILSWLSALWHELLREGAVPGDSTGSFMRALTSFRGSSIIHLEPAPSLVKVMLKIVVSLLTLFILVSHPWRIQIDYMCVQPFALMSTFLLNFCYVGLLKMMSTLEQTPYVAGGECVNVDRLLCDVEMATFRCLRAGFGRAEVPTKDAKQSLPSLFTSDPLRIDICSAEVRPDDTKLEDTGDWSVERATAVLPGAGPAPRRPAW